MTISISLHNLEKLWTPPCMGSTRALTHPCVLSCDVWQVVVQAGGGSQVEVQGVSSAGGVITPLTGVPQLVRGAPVTPANLHYYPQLLQY